MRSLALATILALAPAAVMAASLGVPLDQSVLVALPAPAHNVFLGNPAVADVAMSDQRHVVITGKSGGVTNVIVTDDRGRMIFDRQIVVGATAGDHVSLINGGTVVSYACAPGCEQVSSQDMPSSPQHGGGGLFGNLLGDLSASMPAIKPAARAPATISTSISPNM